MYDRLLSQKIKDSSKSVLLLGPRQTGKSTLIRSLKPALSINLASEKTFLDYSSEPGLLEKDRAYREGSVEVLPWRRGLGEIMGFLRLG